MSTAKPADAKLSALRLLILSPSSATSSRSLFPPVLHALTGTLPPPYLSEDAGTFAGYTSHPSLALRTKYYEADVGLWCDEVPLPGSVGRAIAGPGVHGDDVDDPVTLASWKQQMLSPAAGEVRAAIGGIMLLLSYEPVVFRSTAQASTIPSSPSLNHETFDAYLDLLEVINELREAIEDDSLGREIATVAVVQGDGPKAQGASQQESLDAAAERVEAELLERRGVFGWDVVGWTGAVEETDQENVESTASEKTRVEKNGIERVVEVLELVNWGAAIKQDDGEDDDLASSLMEDNHDDDILQFGKYAGRQDGIKLQSHELEREMMGLKFALHEQDEKDDREASDHKGGDSARDEDNQVEQLQGLMERVVAIREAGAELGKEEREFFAKREVARIMKEIG